MDAAMTSRTPGRRPWQKTITITEIAVIPRYPNQRVDSAKLATTGGSAERLRSYVTSQSSGPPQTKPTNELASYTHSDGWESR